MEVTTIIGLGGLVLILIVISIDTYQDWKENFQDEYKEMMAGYERKKRNGKK